MPIDNLVVLIQTIFEFYSKNPRIRYKKSNEF